MPGDLKFNLQNVEYFLGVGRLLGISDARLFPLTRPNDLDSFQVVLSQKEDGSFYILNSEWIDTGQVEWPFFHLCIRKDGGAVSKEFFSPLPPLFSSESAKGVGSYVVYGHSFAASRESPFLTYIGITRQGWVSRYRQHLNAANNGSPYLLHRALAAKQYEYELHSVFAYGLTFEDAMALEEKCVAADSLYPKGLNMIPGGHAGIRYLHKLGLQNINPRRWENRSALIRQSFKLSAREGRPNPLLAAVWKDDRYASSIICSNPNNFSRDQVGEARLLASFDWSPDRIAEKLNCRLDRVTRLLRGNTYSRVH
jgi:hypothetical protein